MAVRFSVAGVLLATLVACETMPGPREWFLSGLENETHSIQIQIEETPPVAVEPMCAQEILCRRDSEPVKLPRAGTLP
jgi:hypothetical protein